jgi:hypothetical protein
MNTPDSEKQEKSYAPRLGLVVGAIGALLAGMWLSSLIWVAAAPPPPLPPVPTATFTPIPRPTAPPITGSFIELHAQFPQAWPWREAHWQELWTIVQWQDGQGAWHNVEGWQGTLDSVVVKEDGGVIGYKTWWVAEDDLGKGPFRWVIYNGRGGAALATSKSFYLPGALGEIVNIHVTLNPIR